MNFTTPTYRFPNPTAETSTWYTSLRPFPGPLSAFISSA
jgi:hypothetical protein